VLAEEWEPDFEGLYNFPAGGARLSMIARLEIGEGRLLRAGLPAAVHRPRCGAAPSSHSGQREHAQVVDYLDAVTREAGLNARYRTGRPTWSSWSRHEYAAHLSLESWVGLYLLLYLPNVMLTRYVTQVPHEGCWGDR
jgi:hypothetical protein